jgi:hypothetical protein
LFTRQKRLELRNTELAVGIKFEGNRGKRACHIGLLFPHNGPVFHKCPRLISKDLIAPRHQSGDIGNTAAFIGINEKAASLAAKYRPDTREIRTEYRQLGWLVSTASGQARHPVGPILDRFAAS